MAGEEDLENELDFSGAQLRVISMRLLKRNQKCLIFALQRYSQFPVLY